LSELKSQVGFVAPARVEPFPATPTSSLQTLGSIVAALPTKLQGQPEVVKVLAKAGINTKANFVEVASTNIATPHSFAEQAFGSSAPIVVVAATNKPVLRDLPRSRFKDERLYGGDWISGPGGFCSIGFGTSEELGKKSSGERIYAHFALTAGHCFKVGQAV